MSERIAKVAVSSALYWIDRPYDYVIPEKLSGLAVPGVRVTAPFGRGNRKTEGVILAVSDKSEFKAPKPIEAVLDDSPVLTDEQISLAMWMRERFFCTVYDAIRVMLPAGLWFSSSDTYHIADGYDRPRAFKEAGNSKAEAAALEVLFRNGGSCALTEIETAFGENSPAGALSSLVKKGVLISDRKVKRRVNDKVVKFAVLSVPAEEAKAAAAEKKRRAPQQAAILDLMCCVGRASVEELCYFTGASRRSVNALVQAGFIELEEDEVFRRPEYRAGEASPVPELNAEQQIAFDGISALAGREEAGGALLFGVTGSGKTAVYIRLIDETLKMGKSSILLVPEIALTPQMLRTFSSHFGENIAVLHSSLAPGERYDEWKRVRSGLAKVVIGTRSAVFAPARNLGIIIIDEEQEDAYKSETAPRYHARDVAKYRCAKAKALLLLGSATPDVCSRYDAQAGRYGYFELQNRFNEFAMPEVKIVDMKSELRMGNGGSISSLLRSELSANIERGEQSILFINRRGSSKLITCGDCGYTYSCPNCSVSLTYHSANGRLMCHYCGFSRRVDDCCPECGGRLKYTGAGTQKVEEELSELFPDAGIIRMDTDTVSAVKSHDTILSRFRDEKIPIMIGTQMVTKGLDFENVTLVGVISADQSLYCGDYRSAERAFSLMTQVVGRAGRGSKPGRAVIQTFTPENMTIIQASKQDYNGFYESEIALRRIQNSPPFTEVYAVTVSGPDEAQVQKCAREIKNVFDRAFRQREGFDVLGPAPLYVARVNNRYRWRVTLLCTDGKTARAVISGILEKCGTDKKYKGVSVFADVNPSE